jgi:hypothetical protein
MTFAPPASAEALLASTVTRGCRVSDRTSSEDDAPAPDPAAAANSSEPAPRTPLGLAAIIGIYLVGAGGCFWLAGNGTPTGQKFGVGMGPVCILLAFGLWSRSEWARKVVVVLLGVALVAGAGLVLYFLAGVAGVVELPPHVRPGKRLASSIVQVWITLSVFQYLRREDIRALFGREAREPAGPDAP